MSLERKDGRYRLDPEVHAHLVVIAEVDGLDIQEYVERVIVAAVQQRVHAATLIAKRCGCLGISGTGRDCAGPCAARPGISGSGRE